MSAIHRQGDINLQFWIFLFVGIVIMGFLIQAIFGGVGRFGSGSGAKTSLDEFRRTVDSGCETGAGLLERTVTFHDISQVRSAGGNALVAQTGDSNVRSQFNQCRQVVICQQSTAQSTCSAGGTLPGGEQIAVTINYIGQQRAQIKQGEPDESSQGGGEETVTTGDVDEECESQANCPSVTALLGSP